MKTVSIRVVGKKSFKSKKGNDLTIIYFLSSPFEDGVEGSEAGFFFANDDYSAEAEIDENYTAFLGYDRSGKYGVIGLIN